MSEKYGKSFEEIKSEVDVMTKGYLHDRIKASLYAHEIIAAYSIGFSDGFEECKHNGCPTLPDKRIDA